MNGKKLKPLNPDAPVTLAVDVQKLCPNGMTAKHFGAMYTTEFVQRCLQVANVGGDITTDVVKNNSAEIMGRLTYLILTAKTKLRRDIMKSRKTLAVDVYGMFLPSPPLRTHSQQFHR